MKTIVTVCIAILIISSLLFSKQAGKPSSGSDDTKVNKAYVSSSNEFGFSLLIKLVSDGTPGNVFISPASIFLALTMTNDGAEGTTKDAIQATLHLQNFIRDQISSSSAQLMKELMLPDTSVELDVANSLWLNRRFTVKPEFTDDCSQYYSAECFVRDFNYSQTLSEINGWVNAKTKGKIPTILKELAPKQLLVILNAIYFYGKWTNPFDSSLTKEKPFFFFDDSTKNYPRMSQTNTFKYAENSEYQAISIPYGERYSMCVILPRERKDLQKFIAELNQSQWDDLMSRLISQKGTVELPRFKIDYFKSLAHALCDLGMGLAFNDSADFGHMTDTAVCISDVIHKTYLEVNEKGTKAAAVTAVMPTVTYGAYHPRPPEPFVMIVDHPFFCVIRDNLTGLNIFAGAILDPKPDK